jgi:hypothetical protein
MMFMGRGETMRSPLFPINKAISTGDKRVEYILMRRDEETKEIRRTALIERPLDLKLSLWPRMQDGDWEGQRCFIVAGGPSLRGFDFERLRGERVIAINVAYLDMPWADVMFMMDSRLYRWILRGGLHDAEAAKKAFFEFKGKRVFLDLANHHYPEMLYVPATGRHGLSMNLKRGLCHGNNSGVGALNLAFCLGANPIYLLGYDMKHQDGEAHYHRRYPVVHRESITKGFTGDFEEIAPILKKQGVQVINLNPNSGLQCFEFGDVGEVLSHDSNQGLGQDSTENGEGTSADEGIAQGARVGVCGYAMPEGRSADV